MPYCIAVETALPISSMSVIREPVTVVLLHVLSSFWMSCNDIEKINYIDVTVYTFTCSQLIKRRNTMWKENQYLADDLRRVQWQPKASA